MSRRTVVKADAKGRHRCPAWCHVCPDIISASPEPIPEEDVDLLGIMPGCMGGALHGLGACTCDAGRAHRSCSHCRHRRRPAAALAEVGT